MAYSLDGTVLDYNVYNQKEIVVQPNLKEQGTINKLYLRLEGVKNYVGVSVASQAIKITIYDDPSMVFKIHEDSTTLTYATTLRQLNILEFSFSPTTVQVSSIYSITFDLQASLDNSYITSNRLSITLPSSVTFGSTMQAAMLSAGQVLCSSLTNYITWSIAPGTATCEMETTSLLRIYGFYLSISNSTVVLILKSMINPTSSALSDSFLIEVGVQTSHSGSSTWLPFLQNDQSSQLTRVGAVSGAISVNQFGSLDSLAVFTSSRYVLSFTVQSRVPSSGIVLVTFPSDFLFSTMNLNVSSCNFTSGLSNQKTTCLFLDDNTVQMSLGLAQTLAASSFVSLELSGIRNPRSLKPTGVLRIATYSSNSSSGVIDEIKASHNQNLLKVTMTSSSTLSVTSVQPTSFYVGANSIYTIAFTTPSLLISGDILAIDFADLTLPQSVVCSGVLSLTGIIQCSSQVSTNILTVVLGQQIPTQTSISFAVTTVMNPVASTAVINPLKFTLSDAYSFTISSASFSNIAVRSSGSYGYNPAVLSSLLVSSQSLIVGAETTYTIAFTSPVPLSSTTSRMEVSLPADITMGADQLGCFVLAKGVYPSQRGICQYSQTHHQVVITNFFPTSSNGRARVLSTSSVTSVSAGTPLEITLTGIRNKQSNGSFSSEANSQFTVGLSALQSASSSYQQIGLSSYSFWVSFTCESPCATCVGTSTSCTGCSSSYVYQPDESTCLPNCPSQHVRVGNECRRCSTQDSDKHCLSCSASDVSVCTDCEKQYKLEQSSSGSSLCVLITSSNDAQRKFVYDTEFNIPLITVYLLVTSAYMMVRCARQMKELRMTVSLLVIWSLIESIALLVFTAKILLQGYILLLICGLSICAVYIVAHVVFSQRIRRSLRADGNFALFEPNYCAIRAIGFAYLANNAKTMLAYRSRFSHIKDIYNIPFRNFQAHHDVMRRTIFMSLFISIAVAALNVLAMVYAYNYRQVAIPPLFYIEYEVYQLLLIVLYCVLLFSKKESKKSLANIFDVEEDEGNQAPYKVQKLDINSKSAIFLTCATKNHIPLDDLNGGGRSAVSQVPRGLPAQQSQSVSIIMQTNVCGESYSGEQMDGLIGKQKKGGDGVGQYVLRAAPATGAVAGENSTISQSNCDASLSNFSSNLELRVNSKTITPPSRTHSQTRLFFGPTGTKQEEREEKQKRQRVRSSSNERSFVETKTPSMQQLHESSLFLDMGFATSAAAAVKGVGAGESHGTAHFDRGSPEEGKLVNPTASKKTGALNYLRHFRNEYDRAEGQRQASLQHTHQKGVGSASEKGSCWSAASEPYSEKQSDSSCQSSPSVKLASGVFTANPLLKELPTRDDLTSAKSSHSMINFVAHIHDDHSPKQSTNQPENVSQTSIQFPQKDSFPRSPVPAAVLSGLPSEKHQQAQLWTFAHNKQSKVHQTQKVSQFNVDNNSHRSNEGSNPSFIVNADRESISRESAIMDESQTNQTM